MRTIAIVNQKGGCGKTTTAINLAALTARRGQSTLLVDMDPQSHCAAGLGIPEEAIEGGTTAVMQGEADTLSVDEVCWEVGRGFYVLPSTVMLSAVELGPREGLEHVQCRLETFLARCRGRFDRCFIDCPPALGLLTVSALRASTEALIPVETGYFSMQGAQRQWDTIEAVVRRLGRELPRWIVPTIHDPASRLAARILETLTQHFDPWLSPVVIRDHESLREAASLGLPVCEYEQAGSAQMDFDNLIDWLDSLPTGTQDVQQPEVEQRISRAGEILNRLREISRDVPAPAPHLAPLRSTGTAPHGDGYGAVLTPHGIRFRQPGHPEQVLAICGDFNGWSTSATPLRWNPAAGVFEAIVPLPSGSYRYQLVVDGRPGPDPYNTPTPGDLEDGEASLVQVDPSPAGG